MLAITGYKKIKTTANHCSFFFAVILLFLSVPAPALCSDYTGHFSFTSGGLITDDKFSKAFDIDRKFEFGICFDVTKKTWPVSIAFDSSFLHAESETSSNPYNLEEDKKNAFFRADTGLGIKKVFNVSSAVKPFISSGLSLVRIYGKLSDDHELFVGLGYWLGAGVYFELPRNLTCGFQWKRSKTDINIFDINFNTGGDHFSLITGFHF